MLPCIIMDLPIFGSSIRIGLVDGLNNMEMQFTGIKPKDMIGLKEVPLVN